jgi:hypothetical protein
MHQAIRAAILAEGIRSMSDDFEHDESEQAEWVTIGSFKTGFEADMMRQMLEADGIPVLSSSNSPGIFGAAFQGAVPGGITLQVPSPLLERARLLLDGSELDEEPDISP